MPTQIPCPTRVRISSSALSSYLKHRCAATSNPHFRLHGRKGRNWILVLSAHSESAGASGRVLEKLWQSLSHNPVGRARSLGSTIANRLVLKESYHAGAGSTSRKRWIIPPAHSGWDIPLVENGGSRSLCHSDHTADA